MICMSGHPGACLTAMDILVVLIVQLAIRSVNAYSSRGPASFVNDLYKRIFSGNVGETLLMATSVKLNSNTERGDETRANITIQTGVAVHL